MPRRLRKDYPGAWWHVMNRGVARRTFFESRREHRYFLSLLARAVRRGWIEVHAFCLMGNHFHLVVRSRVGKISQAMQWLEDGYVRWFNLRHGRDGPLVRGRFVGKLLHSVTSRRAVMGYVHNNPVAAGIVAHAEAYAWSSARDYARGRGRRWLSRQFGARLPPAVLLGRAVPPDLVRGCLQDARASLRELDQLVLRSPAYVRRWMRANARLADGEPVPRFLVREGTLRSRLAGARALEPQWRVRDGRRALDAWDILEAGLLRTACRLPFRDVADRVGASAWTAQSRARRHARLLRDHEDYARRAGDLLHACLKQDYGGWAALTVPTQLPRAGG